MESPPHKTEPIEPIIKLLTALVVFFILLLMVESRIAPNDGQTFQVISGVLATFSGVLAGRINPMGKKPDQPPPGSTTITKVDQVTETPPQEPRA